MACQLWCATFFCEKVMSTVIWNTHDTDCIVHKLHEFTRTKARRSQFTRIKEADTDLTDCHGLLITIFTDYRLQFLNTDNTDCFVHEAELSEANYTNQSSA